MGVNGTLGCGGGINSQGQFIPPPIPAPARWDVPGLAFAAALKSNIPRPPPPAALTPNPPGTAAPAGAAAAAFTDAGIRLGRSSLAGAAAAAGAEAGSGSGATCCSAQLVDFAARPIATAAHQSSLLTPNRAAQASIISLCCHSPHRRSVRYLPRNQVVAGRACVLIRSFPTPCLASVAMSVSCSVS